MTLVVLYGKPGCCLCEEAREAIGVARRQRSFDLEEVDVSLDPRLHRRYGERIPVVVVDGEEAFEYHVDAPSLLARLDGREGVAR